MVTPTILSSSFRMLSAIDQYESFIWTERWDSCGDFEIVIPLQYADLENLVPDNFIYKRDTDTVMIIETIEIQNDVEKGYHVTVTGRSLESILDRRIIKGLVTINDTPENIIKKLLTQNVINPSEAYRKIDNFVFVDPPQSAFVPMDAQYFCDNLYETIVDLCQECDFGFSITLDNSNRFVFNIVRGVDRSYDQTSNPYVVFSDKFENLSGGDALESNRDYRNCVIIAGEGDGADRKVLTHFKDTGFSGMELREVYSDAGSISKTVYDDEGESHEIPDAEYEKQLKEYGLNELNEHVFIDAFDGVLDSNGQYRYGIDYFIGDIVQVVNSYGLSTRCRVTEVVQTNDVNGTTLSVSFRNIT